MLSQIVTQTREFVAIPPQSIAIGTVNGTEIDTQGYDTVTVYVVTGTITGAGTLDFKLQSTATSGTGYADVTSGAFTQFAGTDDDKIASGSVAIATHLRYMRVVVEAATAAGLACAVVLLSNANETVATADHGTSPAGLTVNI